jgi:hypothetical protein
MTIIALRYLVNSDEPLREIFPELSGSVSFRKYVVTGPPPWTNNSQGGFAKCSFHCFAKGTLLKFSILEVMVTEIFFEDRMPINVRHESPT